MKNLFILILLLCLCTTAFARQGTEQYDLYCNSRFKYCINYPSILLNPQPEAYNGDGRKFNDKKKRDILIVYGCRSVNIDTDQPLPFKQVYKNELKLGVDGSSPTRKITYSKYTKTYFIITGTKGTDIFYQKTILLSGDNDHSIANAILNYPASEKIIYNNVSKQLFQSFKELK